MENTVKNLNLAIDKMCEATGLSRRMFIVIADTKNKCHKLRLKTAYLLERTADFEARRLHTVLSRFWAYPIKLSLNIKGRGKRKVIKFSQTVGIAPTA